MASVALSFSTEPIAGLRFPFTGYCFLLLEITCHTNVSRWIEASSFEISPDLQSVTQTHVHPARLPGARLSMVVRPDLTHITIALGILISLGI